MNTLLEQFIHAVQESLLLTDVQKHEFLDQPELLPESYCEKIIKILSAYDTRAKVRIKRVSEQVENLTMQR